ncbi:Hsp70 family protein [Micromonospora sp. WMMD1120]|uniref:Hsp70 family protein n=1 Tax=Micromonospora sp. WMMD1120 TaxID=3016106 RepID=UPI002417073F|nr:Hsp70 family protein [Micromonospora sp. WMMD1120]MDG4807634.1 Hsp70 family protein [Micromonospora sp. WMMD1120]
MQAGEARLSIDCGVASTVAVLAWADGGASALSFDGLPYLPSAVYVGPDGEVRTGRRAWQAAVEQPGRFIPSPRRAVDGDVKVEDASVEALALAAAPLRTVAAEAERVAGGPVRDVRLVVPAGWGPRRRTWMRQAAHRAGLAQPRLVEAPVAVAEHLLATSLQLPVGAFIVVCDVGAGAEVTVLRRGPAGFEVLSTLADPAAGGATVDLALTAALTTGRNAPGEGVGGWAAAESVRAAKETLGAHPAVTVPLAGQAPVIANSAMLAEAALPVIRRVAELIGETIAAAELSASDLAGIYCVGGSAHLPHLDTVVAEHTGITPTVVPDPQLVAAWGAADAGASNVGLAVAEEVPIPPIRRAVMIAVPGFASLALIWQCLLTAEEHNVMNVYRSVQLNWGELAMAAVFALLACLAAGTVLGSLIAARNPTPSTRTEGGKASIGILAAVSLGAALAGLYAVVTSQYFGEPVGPFLKWALWPIVPIVVMAVAMAVVAARQWRAPHGGWSALLAAPTGSIVTAGIGMGLIQYSLTADRWPDRLLWIDIAGRIGGLLLGVGLVMALVAPLMFRLILSAPVAVISAAIVSKQAAGILGVSYAVAIAMWWAARLWTRILRPATTSPVGRQRSVGAGPSGGGG